MTPCEAQRSARERLEALRYALCEARTRRKEAMREVAEKCRAERIAMHERVRILRARLQAEMRETTRAERAAAQASCRERLAAARETESDVKRAELAYRAEVALERDLRASQRAAEARRLEVENSPDGGGRKESDEEVRAKIARELVPLFDRVKKRIKPGAKESRTVAFLRYAERHPDEVLVAANDVTELRVRELEAEHERLADEVKKPRPSSKGAANPRKGRGPKPIVLHDLKSRDIVRAGRTIEGERAKGQHAEIVVGRSIRLLGIHPNHVDGPKPYDRTFRIGDEAEYDSYNLAYTGEIVSITAKTIAIKPHDDLRHVRRLDIAEFSRRNWDFDAEKVAAQNAETWRHI